MERCGECGYDYQAPAFSDVPDALRQQVATILATIDALPDGRLRVRPEPAVWSALEYACHVRDVLLVQRERVLQALVEDTPKFTLMHRDERVELAAYAQAPTSEVTEELTVAANLLARLAEALSAEQLARRCIYNYPEPTEREIRWVFRHALHEVVHHEMDIRRGIR
jgi:hypothetical protein